MPAFDRTSPWTATSLTYLAFKQQFTEVNSQYWGGVPSEVLTRTFLHSHNGDDDLQAALGVSAHRWTHVGMTVDDYSRRFNRHREWSTLATLVLLTSCFEWYLATAGSLAAESDPLLSPGFPKRVDGAMLLKHGHSVPVDVGPLTRGKWPARIAAYRRLFGSAPPILDSSVGELEKMRQLRNRVAHDFGRPQAAMVSLREARPEALSEARLTKWLGIVDSVTTAIDKHLRLDYIGDFETVRLYHEWSSHPGALMRRAGVQVDPRYRGTWRGFQKVLGGYAQRTPGSAYCREIAGFYSGL